MKENKDLDLSSVEVIVRELESYKMKYPKCVVKESNIKVRNGMRILYERLGIVCNDDFLRRPKIMISIDDGSGDIEMY